MARKKKAPKIRKALPAATPLALERPSKPTKETVIIHTTREKKRNAGGGGLFGGGVKQMVVPLLGGVAGGAATVYATSKLQMHPVAVAAGTAVAGVAIAASVKEQWIQNAALGAAIGAGTLGGLQLLNQATAPKALAQAPAKPALRDAGDGFITRGELNDALSKAAEKQQCDLTTALREEIRKTLADRKRPPSRRSDQLMDPYRQAADDYERNAYGDEDERNAYGDDGERNAYGDDEERNAYGDNYERNADGDDGERNADGDEYERNADGDEYERNAEGDEYERNAYGDDEERNACGDC